MVLAVCVLNKLVQLKKKSLQKLSWLVRWKGASLVAPDGKEVAYNAGDGVQSLGWEDPLEKGMVTHSSILAWTIPWPEEPGGLQSIGHKESDTTEQLNNNNNPGNMYR